MRNSRIFSEFNYLLPFARCTPSKLTLLKHGKNLTIHFENLRTWQLKYAKFNDANRNFVSCFVLKLQPAKVCKKNLFSELVSY